MSPVSVVKVPRTVVCSPNPVRNPHLDYIWFEQQTNRPWLLGYSPVYQSKKNREINGYVRSICWRYKVVGHKSHGSRQGRKFKAVQPLLQSWGSYRYGRIKFQVMRVPTGLFDQAKQRYLRTEICTQIFFGWWGKYVRPAIAQEIVLEHRPVAPAINPLIAWNIRFLHALEAAVELEWIRTRQGQIPQQLD